MATDQEQILVYRRLKDIEEQLKSPFIRVHNSYIINYVERHCRLFIALLQAAHEGSFRHMTNPAQERLLRVLAYVRKDDDEIPDYKPNGFADDQREVHAAAADLGSLLNVFKSWRLCHQVPGLWNKVAPTSPQNSHLVEPTATRALRF